MGNWGRGEGPVAGAVRTGALPPPPSRGRVRGAGVAGSVEPVGEPLGRAGDHLAVGDGCHPAQASAALRAGEPVDGARGAQQRGPGNVRRAEGWDGGGGPRAGRRRAARRVRVAAAAQRQGAVGDEQVDARARNHRGPLLEQLAGLEADGSCAVALRPAQPQQHPALRRQGQRVLGDRRAQHGAAQMLEPTPVAGPDREVGVQVEALAMGVSRAAGADHRRAGIAALIASPGGRRAARWRPGRGPRRLARDQRQLLLPVVQE